jgi:uncharacterized repeat protein (TIGR03943 family)
VLKASVTDLYLRYVKAELRPFLIGAGAVLVAAAIMTLWYELRQRAAPLSAAQHDRAHGADDHDGGHSHGHGHHEPRIGWLLLLPVLGLLLVAPPALGSYAAGQSGTAIGSAQVSDFPPLPEGDPAKIGVLDYASRAVFDGGRSIGDRRVQLTGFLMAGPDGAQFLARIVLSCCAADGRPVKVAMSGAAPTGLTPDTWVEIVGRYTKQRLTDPVNGEAIPYLEVEQWRQISPPKNQYE